MKKEVPTVTLEEAQARIIALTEEVQTLTAERDSLSQNNETLKNESEELRKLNQTYFNKLIAQHKQEEEKEEEEETVLTCEEFAATLNI